MLTRLLIALRMVLSIEASPAGVKVRANSLNFRVMINPMFGRGDAPTG